MSTETINLTGKPVQITSGSEYAFIKSEDGRVFKFADSDDEPVDTNAFQTVTELSVYPPFVIWVWSGNGFGVQVSVSKRSAE